MCLFNRKSSDISLFYFYPFNSWKLFWMSLVKYILLLLLYFKLLSAAMAHYISPINSFHIIFLCRHKWGYSHASHISMIYPEFLYSISITLLENQHTFFLPQILKNSSIHPKYLTTYSNFLVMHIFLYAV